MASVNKVILVGNLGKDPEIRFTLHGTAVVNFTLATSEQWKDKTTGEKKQHTDWHNVVVWGDLAKIVAKYAKKGSKVYVEGQLKTRKWQDQAGADRYTTEVVLQGFSAKLVLLSDARGSAGEDAGDTYEAPGGDRGNVATPREKAAAQGGGFNKQMDDEIPFCMEWRA